MRRDLLAAAIALGAMACGVNVGWTGTVLSLTNDQVIVSFDDGGCVTSVRERATARELASRSPFVGISVENCGFLGADRTELKDGRLVFGFPGDFGSIEAKVEPFDGGWTFVFGPVDAPKAKRVFIGRICPSFGTYFGTRANMVSDDASAVCLRPYDLRASMSCKGGVLCASIGRERAEGVKVGLAAGRKAKIVPMLKAMTRISGRAHSPGGGAWTLDTDAARNSYLNANVSKAKLDDWIDLMERGGFGVLHFRERWYDCRGHYPVNTNDWPNGLADMKAAVGKVHAAGYLAGMHTLTACIDPKDPWVAGDENRFLRAREGYRLAEDLSATATELTVDAPPKCRHDTVFTYSGNGNALRIGTEIVQYAGFTTTAPYKYTGLVRGAFGTTAAAHAKGDETDYLEQRYLAFYPEPDSPLADKVADAIANVYNTCGFDQIYCDGAEAGSGTDASAYTAVMRDKIIRRCAADGRPVLNEDSCSCPAGAWWMHSRIGAWDSCYWAPKAFHDFHVEAIKAQHVREANLLEIQMGWWAPNLSCPHYPAQKIDEIEYYASRNAGLDASMSIAGIGLDGGELAFHLSRMMTVLGWYERARRARAFAPGVREAMDAKGAEFRLRQDAADGVWKIAPVRCGRGALTLAEAPVSAALRVEALYSGAPADGRALNLTGDVPAERMSCQSASDEISVSVRDGVDEGGARTIRLAAENRGASARGAWACVSAKFPSYRSPDSRWVMRFRVRGDGSGALLNVQPHTPREFGEARAEHYVTLDFTGWKEFEIPFRERDSDRYADYVWPYRGYAEVFHRILNMNNLDAVNFYLNEIPAGGGASAEITDIVLVEQIRTAAVRSEVVVNGSAIPVPFALTSGDWAELEDGVWTRYDENGKPLERRVTGERVPLGVGANTAVFRGSDASGGRTRGEVRLFAVGRPEPALVDPTGLDSFYRRFLDYEAADPDWFAPARGLEGPKAVVMRPGERATVEFRFSGEISEGVLTFAGRRHPLKGLKGTERFRLTADGLFEGVQPVCLEAAAANCRVEIVKRYR